MKRVHIRPDPFKKETWTSEDVDNVCAYLFSEFTQFPENARIYHGAVARKNDVTPTDALSIEKLQSLEGEFYIVIYPSYDPITIALWVVWAITAAFSVYTYMTMPKPQVSAPQSANNDLASRQNQARLGGRIPEIFGGLRAVPDLISAAATYFDANNKEIEECLMVLGRGYHQIHDCKEDQTHVSDIPGTSISVYDPDTSIIGTPIYKVGETFTDAPLFTLKSKSINGQTLNVPNDQKVESTHIYFEYPNLIKTASLNFASMFVGGESIGIYGAEFSIADATLAGQTMLTTAKQLVIESAINIANVNDFNTVVLSNALIKVITEVQPVPPDTEVVTVENYYDLSGRYKITGVSKSTIDGGFHYVFTLTNPELINSNWQYITVDQTVGANLLLTENDNSINLNGTYTIQTVSTNTITLVDPELSNFDWSKLGLLPNQNTQSQSLAIRLDKLNNSWVGWYNLDLDNAEELILNFFYQNGLFYQDSKGGVWYDQMTALVQYQYIEPDGQPVGQIYDTYFTIANNSKSPFGTTRRISLATPGKIRFRLARTTPTKNDKTQDLTKIRDVYAASRSTILNYGDVTVVRSRTLGTEGALSLKERKLNMLVTRKLPWNGTGGLTATKSAAQALIYLALDDRNGRRSKYEIDIPQITAEIESVNNYFASDKASEFSYTFDDSNLSFEEMAGMIASACFCETYRFGNKLRLKCERPQENSVLLFNHRNKAPGSEKRTYSQGIAKDYDGIELEYTSSIDDARVKYVVPNDMARNPLSIKTSGIRNEAQAITRAWREWNKLLYRHTDVEFVALSESEILNRNDRILVADNTIQDTQDGDVEHIDGLVVFTSQPVLFDSTVHYAYLQMPTGSVDMIQCMAGENEYEIILTRAPIEPLITEDEMLSKTKYLVVKASTGENEAFLLSEMEPSDERSNLVKCVNYDARYYQNDHDFLS